MKRNIYSYSKLWMIFFVLMGAACTNQVEDVIPVSGQPIEFSVQSDWKEIPNTRLNDGKKQFGAGDKIQIFGFHKYSSEGEVKFMYSVDDPKKQRGQIVTLDDNNNWNYSPKRFWPKEGTLDFYASYPDYSVLNEGDKMTYVQPDFNPLGVDLLWGLATDRKCAEAETVPIWMVHALARVNIFFDSSLGDIKQAKVSAYKAGDFSNAADNGVPLWNVDKTSDKNIQEATISPYENQQTIGDATVFILPDRITGLKLIKLDGRTEIDVSDKIQKYTFEAGKVYNLTISKGVQKKNTNSRSIAMSVRCVSE